MGDLLLPETKDDLYSGIQSKIKNIFKDEIEDKEIEEIDPVKLKFILKPLVSMFLQIDELTFKCKRQLSQHCFVQIERFIKEIIDITTKRDDEKEKLNKKKKQICDYFCDQFKIEAHLDKKDPKFKHV